MMKKIGLAVAVTAALGAAPVGVQAYTMAVFDVGQLVPQAWFKTGDGATYVGLISRCPGTLYWTWFNKDSQHIVDDAVPMTKYDQWSWNLQAIAPGLGDERGYAVFLFDLESDPAFPNKGDERLDAYDDEQCLASSAFWVDIPNNDVAYVPTFPLALDDIALDARDLKVPLPDYDAISSLVAGAQLDQTIYKRYYVNGVLGDLDRTEIVTWTVCKPPASQNLRWYNHDQDWISAVYPTPNDELNWFDPEPTLILATKGAFVDGFIPWPVKAAANPYQAGAGAGQNLRYCNHNNFDLYSDNQAAVSYSQMYSTVTGAEQTIVNAHTRGGPRGG